jgi:hypothetical protein
MGIALAIVLGALLAAHVALVVPLVRGLVRQAAWLRAAMALFVVPLAPWWGYRVGMRLRALAWTVALGLYTVGLFVAARY